MKNDQPGLRCGDRKEFLSPAAWLSVVDVFYIIGHYLFFTIPFVGNSVYSYVNEALYEEDKDNVQVADLSAPVRILYIIRELKFGLRCLF